MAITDEDMIANLADVAGQLADIRAAIELLINLLGDMLKGMDLIVEAQNVLATLLTSQKT